MSKSHDPTPPVAALVRGLRILKCFDRPGVELSVSEVARRSGLTQPTAWRLCRTLLSEGFLAQAQDGVMLRIGLPVLSLGFAAIRGLGFPEAVKPALREIALSTGGTTSLTLLDGAEIQSIDQCDGELAVSGLPVGWRGIATELASGLAVLAMMPAEDRERLIEREPALVDSAQKAKHLDAALEQCAAFGYVHNLQLNNGPYVAVAIALRDTAYGDGRYWAISCGGLRQLWDRPRLDLTGTHLLREAPRLQAALDSIAALSPKAK